MTLYTAGMKPVLIILVLAAFAGSATAQENPCASFSWNRIALDQPAWIDVVADGQAIASSDYQGRTGCRAPHKLVQFSLPAGKDLLIQLSGTPETRVRLTITRVEQAATK
jgi:hypothetical protein